MSNLRALQQDPLLRTFEDVLKDIRNIQIQRLIFKERKKRAIVKKAKERKTKTDRLISKLSEEEKARLVELLSQKMGGSY